MEQRKTSLSVITLDIGPYQSIKANFEADRFPGCPLLDTYVELEVPRFCITWNDRMKLMEELAKVIEKYQI